MSDLISKIPERDCDTCKHYVVVSRNNGEEIKACESWECKYENRSDEE